MRCVSRSMQASKRRRAARQSHTKKRQCSPHVTSPSPALCTSLSCSLVLSSLLLSVCASTPRHPPSITIEGSPTHDPRSLRAPRSLPTQSHLNRKPRPPESGGGGGGGRGAPESAPSRPHIRGVSSSHESLGLLCPTIRTAQRVRVARAVVVSHRHRSTQAPPSRAQPSLPCSCRPKLAARRPCAVRPRIRRGPQPPPWSPPHGAPRAR